MQYHPIGTVFRDFKAATYSELDAAQLAALKPGAPATLRLLAPLFQRVSLVYGHSALATVEGKVSAVKDVMTASVARALQSVEQLEDMEESSERFEEQSKQFHKKTAAVKKQHRKVTLPPHHTTPHHTTPRTHSPAQPAPRCSRDATD